MGGRLGEDGDAEAHDAGRVQDDGRVVQVLEQVHAERVDDAVRDEERGVDADGLGRGGLVVWVLDRRHRRDQVGQAERDACRYCNIWGGQLSLSPPEARGGRGWCTWPRRLNHPVIQAASAE